VKAFGGFPDIPHPIKKHVKTALFEAEAPGLLFSVP
jgi:hypothetical protein